MNIKANISVVEVYLEMANEKVERQDFEGALEALASAYSHVRELLEQVQKLSALKTMAERSAKDVPG